MSEQEELERPLQITAVCGSLRPTSFTRMALEVALEGARELGVVTSLLDLRDYDLPLCDGKVNDSDAPPGVRRLRDDLRTANGIILGTPEYHGGYSGVLKNALDLTGFEEFGSKVVGLVGVSGGAIGAMNALNGLRAVGRSLHAWVVPHQVSVPEAWKRFGSDGRLKDERYTERLKKVGREVARFTYLHTSSQVQEFLRLWEESLPNPGGK